MFLTLRSTATRDFLPISGRADFADFVYFAKIWNAQRQHFGFFENWRNFGNPEKFGKFLKLESHLFYATC